MVIKDGLAPFGLCLNWVWTLWKIKRPDFEHKSTFFLIDSPHKISRHWTQPICSRATSPENHTPNKLLRRPPQKKKKKQHLEYIFKSPKAHKYFWETLLFVNQSRDLLFFFPSRWWKASHSCTLVTGLSYTWMTWMRGSRSEHGGPSSCLCIRCGLSVTFIHFCTITSRTVLFFEMWNSF